MMKVCLLNDSFPPVIDGVANTVENYASVMTEEGLAEAVVATPAYPDADYELFPYKVYPYKSIDTTALIHGYRAGNPLNHKTIADIRRFGPDIIHTHCPFSSTVLARLIRTETHAPIVFTYHTKFDYDIRMAVKAKFLQKEAVNLIVKNVSACDEVWTVSKGAGEDLKALGYSGEYRVMNNGVDFDKGTVSDELVKEAIGEKDVPGDIPLFLFVGRIMEYKGIPIIIDAMKKLSESGINYRMVFVGGGTDREKLEQRVKDNGIAMDSYDGDKCTVTPGKDGMSGKIIFVGPVYDRDLLRAWNTRADLFLFPSTYDTNGIVVREAAACGTASVLIRDSCASEGITDGRNGFLINENADSMYDLLKEIAPKRDVMRQAGENAMDEIYISWSDSVKVAVERYSEIIEAGKPVRKFMARPRESMSEIMQELKEGLITENNRLRSLTQNVYAGMLSNSNSSLDDRESAGVTMRELIKDKLGL